MKTNFRISNIFKNDPEEMIKNIAYYDNISLEDAEKVYNAIYAQRTKKSVAAHKRRLKKKIIITPPQ